MILTQMVLPHENSFLVIQLDLNWLQSEQSNIISRFCALAWKEQTDFN